MGSFGKLTAEETEAYKAELSFFVCYVSIWRTRFEQLTAECESDEFISRVKAYESLIRMEAGISYRQFNGTYFLDGLKQEERDALFFDSIDIVHNFSVANGIDKTESEIIKLYIETYGKPYDIEKRLLEAEVTNRLELADALKKYCNA